VEVLPPDFGETLAAVLESGHEAAAARIITAASGLDDEGLQVFLELFAERVRESSKPVSESELERFLRAASAEKREPPTVP
jgi:hypothetical protein